MDNDTKKAIQHAASLWLGFLKEDYDERWWEVIKMTLRRSSQPNMDEMIAYKTGIVWYTFYDLARATSKGLKSSDVLFLLLEAITEEYKLPKGKAKRIFFGISEGGHPEAQFFLIYGLFDSSYKYDLETESEDALLGFNLIFNRMDDDNKLSQMLNHKFD